MDTIIQRARGVVTQPFSANKKHGVFSLPFFRFSEVIVAGFQGKNRFSFRIGCPSEMFDPGVRVCLLTDVQRIALASDQDQFQPLLLLNQFERYTVPFTKCAQYYGSASPRLQAFIEIFVGAYLVQGSDAKGNLTSKSESRISFFKCTEWGINGNNRKAGHRRKKKYRIKRLL